MLPPQRMDLLKRRLAVSSLDMYIVTSELFNMTVSCVRIACLLWYWTRLGLWMCLPGIFHALLRFKKIICYYWSHSIFLIKSLASQLTSGCYTEGVMDIERETFGSKRLSHFLKYFKAHKSQYTGFQYACINKSL